MATTRVALREAGLFLMGDVLSIRPGRVWTGRDGVVREPWVVAVLVGDAVFKVEYRSREDAEAAAVTGPGADDGSVSLRVYPRAVQGRVYYGGQSVRGGVDAG